jgi:hypothetical protein
LIAESPGGEETATVNIVLQDPEPPGGPEVLTGVVDGGSGAITLSWDYPHPFEELGRIEHFRIYRANDDCVTFLPVAMTEDNMTFEWVDDDPGPDVCYYVVGVYGYYSEEESRMVYADTSPTNLWRPAP